MLPLAGSPLPTSPETLVEALRAGLAAHGIAPHEVSARGPWPQLEALSLDLTGTTLDAVQPLRPAPADPAGATFTTRSLTLRAAPAHLHGSPLEFELTARDAAFGTASASAGSGLQLLSAAEGNVVVQMPRSALEKLIHQSAAKAAGEHGVEIKKTCLTLTQRGPRALSFVAEVTAKAFIASATVTISGDAEVDAQLVARISNLRFGGAGMIANLAGGVIRPVLTQLEGREFPLRDFALGTVTLRDLQLEAGETLRLTAQFGDSSRSI